MRFEYPKLRYGLEATPIVREGKRFFLLSDRLGYQEESLVLSPDVLRLVAEMNGENSLRDLQLVYMKLTGDLIQMEDLNAVVELLEDRLFLDGERFRGFVEGETRRFEQDPIRRMHHAGRSYPEDSKALREELGKLFDCEASSPTPTRELDGRRLVGLMAPHIDIRAGASCFVRAYRACMETIPPAIWVVLGTGHEPVENYFALLDKDFETPLGAVSCDHESCDYLSRHASRNLFAGSYTHRREHSIEFQAVFLALVQPSARIVPILCSFSEEEWKRDRKYIDEVAGLLGDLTRIRGESVGFLASVDLAHVGPRYGDAFSPTQSTVAHHLSADRELLAVLEECRAVDFIQEIDSDQNSRRVCGVAPLYTMAKVLEGSARGKVLDHSFAAVDNENSFVTFASMAFYGSV